MTLFSWTENYRSYGSWWWCCTDVLCYYQLNVTLWNSTCIRFRIPETLELSCLEVFFNYSKEDWHLYGIRSRNNAKQHFIVYTVNWIWRSVMRNKIFWPFSVSFCLKIGLIYILYFVYCFHFCLTHGCGGVRGGGYIKLL